MAMNFYKRATKVILYGPGSCRWDWDWDWDWDWGRVALVVLDTGLSRTRFHRTVHIMGYEKDR
jgi:hypothetical protein